jgi:hypothetical protein
MRVLWHFSGTIAEFRRVLRRQRAELNREVTPVAESQSSTELNRYYAESGRVYDRTLVGDLRVPLGAPIATAITPDRAWQIATALNTLAAKPETAPVSGVAEQLMTSVLGLFNDIKTALQQTTGAMCSNCRGCSDGTGCDEGKCASRALGILDWLTEKEATTQ